MQLGVAFVTLLASIGLTYFFCVRPMRNGRHCGMSPPGRTGGRYDRATTGATGEDLRVARDELAALRADLSHGTGLAPGSEATPGRTGETAAPGSSQVGRAG